MNTIIGQTINKKNAFEFHIVSDRERKKKKQNCCHAAIASVNVCNRDIY